MTSHDPPGCIVVTGMPGAGKSTVTDLVARRLPLAAQIKGDAVSYMVLSGRVSFQDEDYDEALRQSELCSRNMCALANNFIDYGFTALIDTMVPVRAKLDLLVRLMAPRPVRLVVLAPGIEACRYRNSIREPSERFSFNGYEQLEADMRREVAPCGWWFDTSALTPEETADEIVRRVKDLPILSQ